MWNRPDDPSQTETGPGSSPSPPQARRPGDGPRATIGHSLAIDGTLTGDEDLQIEGRFDGEIRIPGHEVTIGRQGKVEAEIRARRIIVEGQLSGNLVAEEQAVVRASGRVEGDIQAPKVALEEGCHFKGQIAMEPVKKEASSSSGPESSVDRFGSASAKSKGSGSASKSGDSEDSPSSEEQKKTEEPAAKQA